MSDTSSKAIDVSVIIPTYNRLWCLPAAVESCRRAACRVEIIVVDDGSTDGTWAWLETQPDVVALRQPNQGKDWAVARGMSVARGRYVRFLDSDDALLSGAIDRQVTLGDEAGADVVTAGMLFTDERGGVIARTQYARCDDFLAQQLGETEQSHYSAYLFRREFVAHIPHRQEFGALDDRMFMIEVAMRHPCVAVLEGQALRHVKHASERLQSAQGIKHVVKTFNHLQVYRSALAQLEQQNELTPQRASAAASILWRLAHWIAATHPDDACEVVRWIQHLDPGFTPPEPGILGICFRRLGFRRTQHLLRLRRRLLAPIRRRSKAPLFAPTAP